MPLDINLRMIAEPLGHVAIEFSYLEIDLGHTISRLARTDDLVGSVFASLPLRTKTGIIRTLAAMKLTDPAQLARVKDLMKRVDNLGDKRNSFVHGEFMPVVDPNDNLLSMQHRAVRKSDQPFEDVDASTLETLSGDVHQVAYELREFSATVYDLNP